MRSAGEIRERALGQINAMLLRPSMYGVGRFLEDAIRAQLQDLAFIDTRETELERLFAELHKRDLFGSCGTWGTLSAELGPGDFTYEIASIYARLAARLGYFQPANRISDSELSATIADALTWAKAAPRSPADLSARFGPPSYLMSSPRPRVCAYSDHADDAWLYFDFSDSPQILERVRHDTLGGPHVITAVRARERNTLPEDVYRDFLIATLSGNRQLIEGMIHASADPSPLWGAAYPEDVAKLLAEQYRTMQIVRVGVPDDVIFLVSDGCPVPLAIVHQRDGWRVDPTPLIEMRACSNQSN